MQKKFAHKLNEHNEHTKKMLDIANELMVISKDETERGNVELAEDIADVAKKCTHLVGEITQTFEEEYVEELRLLMHIVENDKNKP